jgi:tRNA(Ile)-lysidine synthetase-like protein
MVSSDADVVTRVQRQVAEALDRLRLLRSSRHIVAAVSGGADSLCMLDALVATLPRAGRRLTVGHVDHMLRPDSSSDAEHVRSVAAGYRLGCVVERVDVPMLAWTEGRGIEDAARLARYRVLRDMQAESGTSTVATGHTRDDSIETVLLHLLRGSGPRGLSGIRDAEVLSQSALGETTTLPLPRTLRLVRPLLGVSRGETVSYCQARGIRWLTDESNVDPTFLRNRVRGHLLPVLRTYNPAIDDALERLSIVSRDDDEFLQSEGRRRFLTVARPEGGRLRLDARRLRAFPIAVQRQVIKVAAAYVGSGEIEFIAVERALAVGAKDGPQGADLGGGLTVQRRADALVFDLAAR